MAEENVAEENKRAQRKRAQNFAEAEKMILINLIHQYKNVLENKKSDTVTSKDKEKCWKIIQHSFNSRSSGECRSSEVLKSCWDNLKKKTRKFFADRMQLYKTGGGPCESRSNVLLECVREIIKPSVDSLTNNFDSDDIRNDTINSCNFPTISNTNLYEASTNNTIWLDEIDNITDESMHEGDVPNFLKNQSNAGMGKDSPNNVLNIHTKIDYNNENDTIENEIDSDLNIDNLHYMVNENSKQKGKMQKLQKQNIEKTSVIGILTSNISTPLKKSKFSKHNNSLGNNKGRKQYKKEESITSKISQYNILGDSKIELVQFMVEDLKAKSEIEINILKTQLEKEQLEVKVLKTELELKEDMLQSKQQKLRS